jgi:hypothetical protein
VDKPHERTSAGDPSESPHACRGVAAVEVAAEHGSAATSEQCCSEWPSSASGAGRTAPESEVEASAAAGRYFGCSACTLVVLPLLARTGAGAPGVHHLFAAEQSL